MNVQDLLDQKGSSEVYTIRPERTVAEAISRLVERNVGALVVTDAGGRPVGIITERDILRCCSGEQHDRPRSQRVSEVMTSDLLVGERSDDVDYVMGVMTQSRIRHLPVMDGESLVGMVSIGDVVSAQLHATTYENRHLKQYISGSY